MPTDKLERTKNVLEALNRDYLTVEQFKTILGKLTDTVVAAKNDFTTRLDAKTAEYVRRYNATTDLINSTANDLRAAVAKKADSARLESEIKRVQRLIEGVRALVPEETDLSSIDIEIARLRNAMPAAVDEAGIRRQLDDLSSSLAGLQRDMVKLKDARSPGPRLFGAGVRGFQLLVDGLKKGQVNYFNLVAGEGVTLTHNTAAGRNDVIVNASGGTGSGGASVLALVAAPIVPASVAYTFPGHVILAISDDGVDSDATLAFNSGLNQTVVTYSVSPQNNAAALTLQSVTTQLLVPAGVIDGVNQVFTVLGRVILANEDRLLDTAASVAFNLATGISTITYSVPPQNEVSALVASGVAMNQQVPQGVVDGVNVTFLCAGRISVPYADSGVDVVAAMPYNFSTNQTIITYSVPPQNSVYAY
jgi:hypothetical protein